MAGEHLVRLLQITGAALGIPAAAAGTFAAYQSYFSTDVTCQKLRNDIIGIMERNVPPETKRSLLKKEVTEFDKLCGERDPEARVIFQAAMSDHPGEAHAPAAAGPAPVSASSQRAQLASLTVLARQARRSTTAGSRSVAASRARGCRTSPATPSPIRRCRLPGRFYPPRSCCRSGTSRRAAPTIRPSCKAGCRPALACACWQRAAAPAACGPRSPRPHAREGVRRAQSSAV
jgi:hypothetical protein